MTITNTEIPSSSSSGSKYVPPHLRNQGGGSTGGGRAPGPRASYGSNRSSNYGDQRGSYDNRRGSDYRGRQQQPRADFVDGPAGDTGSEQGSDVAAPRANNRWSNVNLSSGGGGGYERNDRKGSYQSQGGGYGRGPRVNERGFHGDMRPDSRLERQLFDRDDVQTTGINFDRYDNIPIETSGADVPDPIEAYNIDTIGEDLMRNTQLCGYTKPTPVQKYSIPIAGGGRDLMACAQTGSGKTAGFLFPIIITMLRNGGSPPPPDARRRVYPEALVLAPTRELASQIHDESRKFTYCTGIASVCIYGGADVRDQLRQIERGCDLLIATPGRLVDLIERGRISMENIKFLVLDEADRMLDMGFEPQIRRIVEQEDMPQGDGRQTMMFSATFPSNIQRLASDFLRDYIFLTVGRVGSASKDVTQSVEYVDNRDKMDVLMRFLLTLNEGLILIFVETKRSCDNIEDILCAKGFPACSIHGDKSQREREDALRSFRSGSTPVMVATDVAARGLDIPNVTNVINYDLPTNIDDYVHRIGRTGRAGNTGAALSFLNEKNTGIAKELRDLLDENNQEVPAWLNKMCSYNGRGSNSRRGGRGGGSSFGSRDVRMEKNHGRGSHSSHSQGGYGNYGGGGYGNNYGGGGNFNDGMW